MLANASGQSRKYRLTDRIRQQAGSHGYDVGRRFYDLCMTSVGAGLLAKASGQSRKYRLTDRIRQQAGSYRFNRVLVTPSKVTAG